MVVVGEHQPPIDGVEQSLQRVCHDVGAGKVFSELLAQSIAHIREGVGVRQREPEIEVFQTVLVFQDAGLPQKPGELVEVRFQRSLSQRADQDGCREVSIKLPDGPYRLAQDALSISLARFVSPCAPGGAGGWSPVTERVVVSAAGSLLARTRTGTLAAIAVSLRSATVWWAAFRIFFSRLGTMCAGCDLEKCRFSVFFRP